MQRLSVLLEEPDELADARSRVNQEMNFPTSSTVQHCLRVSHACDDFCAIHIGPQPPHSRQFSVERSKLLFPKVAGLRAHAKQFDVAFSAFLRCALRHASKRTGADETPGKAHDTLLVVDASPVF